MQGRKKTTQFHSQKRLERCFDFMQKTAPYRKHKNVSNNRSERKPKRNDIPKAHKSVITMNEILNMWLQSNETRLKPSTLYKYEFLIYKHISPEIGEKAINNDLPYALNHYMNLKSTSGRLNGKGGLSQAYMQTIAVIIKSAISYAVENNLCTQINPFKLKIKQSDIGRKDLCVLSRQEQKILEEALLKDIDPTKLGVFITLNTGIRIGEVCSLRWADIDTNNQVIHVKSTLSRIKASTLSGKKTELIIDVPKTKSALRSIPISSRLLPILKKMKEVAQSDYVISKGNGFVSMRTYEYRFHKILDNCKIRAINYHVLRHTFATRCVEAGMDVKTLSEILGHSNIGITMNTYVHPSMESKREQLEKTTSYF